MIPLFDDYGCYLPDYKRRFKRHIIERKKAGEKLEDIGADFDLTRQAIWHIWYRATHPEKGNCDD